MRTAVVLAGIVALASAAPAASNVASHENRQDSNWHIGCDGKGDTKSLNATCSYYQAAARGAVLIHARSAIPPRSPNAGSPPYTSTRPAYTSPVYYKPKYMSTSSEYNAYKPKYTSTSPDYNAYYPPPRTPSYGPPEYTHAPYSPPKHTPSYSSYTFTSQYAEPHYSSHHEKPYTTSHYEEPHTTSHYEKPYSVYAPPTEPTTAPTCNFVEEECIDCTKFPEDCETCNFMFLCGEKKQCTYLGFRETVTMCKETGAECAWDEYDHRYDIHEDEFEHPHGEKPEYPYAEPEEPEYPSHDEPEYPYSDEPEYPSYDEPSYPSHDKPEHTYGGKLEHPHGSNDTEHEYPHGPWGSALHVNHTSI